MSSLSLNSVARGISQASTVRCANGHFRLRSLHSSSAASLVLRKAKSAQSVEDAFEEDEEIEEDLFSTSSPTSSSKYQLDKSSIRQSNVSSILKHAKLPAKEKRKDKLSIQALRQVAACSQPEEAEQLKSVIRAWRVGGLKVSKTTAREIIGRLCNIGKPEVASELISNRLQYGLPDIDQPTLIKLHQSLISSSLPSPKLPFTQPISPTLALLRLSLAQQTEGSNPEQETLSLSTSPKGRTWKPTKAVEGWANQARERLTAAGGAWASAAQNIQRSQ
ncbi:uncharacterized protein IL334_001539 [Kwoniella shivajii]|uniref:Uncharacterized protein n=1 Tax=Kwoniella shivajii TaxID=564305 RepID=A0ABZ1CSG4_9TREE|nr:hypothetical protein IL334_001539 [Kwoniella shivajii]